MRTLTAAASRTLHLADHLAAALNVPLVSPIHLLWALILDESIAGEILQESGVSPIDLVAVCPLPESIVDFSTPRPTLLQWPGEGESGSIAGDRHAASSTSQTTSATNHRHDAELLAVILAAEVRQDPNGRDAEIGTEDLLFGLCRVESAGTSAILQRYRVRQRVDPESIVAVENVTGDHRADVQSQPEPPPLPVDVQLRIPRISSADQTDVYRMLDAAANRCREGYRVVEDYCRFALNDGHLTEQLKRWRHTLTELTQQLDTQKLVRSRDTTGDVGTRITTRTEQVRDTLQDVLLAAIKRVQESLRTLEEVSKVVSGVLGPQFESLRYEFYNIEKGLLQTIASRARFEGVELYLLLTERLCPHGSGPVLRAALQAGVRCVQVREKDLSDRLLLDHCKRVQSLTSAASAVCLVNDRCDIAALAHADGVHVGQDDISIHEARHILGPDKIVGVSTHTISQATAAVLAGADYIGVGPTFATQTKSFQEFPGLEFVNKIAATITLPAFAIGGITAANLRAVLQAGAKRVAVSSAICSAEDPYSAAAELLEIIRDVTTPIGDAATSVRDVTTAAEGKPATGHSTGRSSGHSTGDNS